MNQQIAQWYENETGLNANQGQGRIEKIEKFLNERQLNLSEVKIRVRKVNTKYGYKPLVATPDRERIGTTSHSAKRTTEYYVEVK